MGRGNPHRVRKARNLDQPDITMMPRADELHRVIPDGLSLRGIENEPEQKKGEALSVSGEKKQNSEPALFEKQKQEKIDSLIRTHIRKKQKKIGFVLQEIEKLMADVRCGGKKLVPLSEWYDKDGTIRSADIIEHAIEYIKTDDEGYKQALEEIVHSDIPLESFQEIRESYLNQDLNEKDLDREIMHSVEGYFERLAHKNPIMSEMLYLAEDIKRGKKIAVADTEAEMKTKVEKVVEKEKEAEKKQKEDFVRQILSNNERLKEIIFSSIGRGIVPETRLYEVINKIRSEKKVEREILEELEKADSQEIDTFVELDVFIDKKLAEIVVRDYRKILVPEEEKVLAVEKEEVEFSPEQIMELQDLVKEASEYRNELKALIKWHGKEKYWSEDDILARCKPHIRELFLESTTAESNFAREEIEEVVNYVISRIKK